MTSLWPWFFFGMGIWGSGLEEVSLPLLEKISLSPPALEWQYNPVLSAKSVFVMDTASGGKNWSKNEDMPLPMASLTKLMTAIVIIENHSLDEIVTVTQTAAKTEGSTMHLEEGEQITVQNLLLGLLINSANDAAVALAIYDAGSVMTFVEKMNDRARILGLYHTHFANPHGLDAENHFSSAFDLALLAKYSLQFDFIRRTVIKKSEEALSIDGRVKHLLKNTNDLLFSPFPVYGMKTGTTDNANECLIIIVKKQEKEYIFVILGSEDRYLDAKTLLYPILSEDK
jgi:serine-type D-Ala-D-Ala carboxypeptidase (penicillin-binding protein 5/6)